MKINKKVGKSIVGSIVFKLSSAVISLISVPLLLQILGTNNYAVWVTITAIVGWLNVFDFGSGYSLKNKVTEAYAKNDTSKIQGLIAGTIQFYLLLSFALLIIFAISIFFIKVFETHVYLSVIVFLPIILAFPFTLGHFIIQGLKKFNLFNLILFSQTFCWLLILLAFKHGLFKSSIEVIAYCYSLLFVAANFLILKFSLREINFPWREVFSSSKLKSSQSSLITGSKFFLLQISSLFLFSLGNILTYNNLSLKSVAQYDTVNKIYLMGITIFNVIITVFWTEISHAKALMDKLKLYKIYKQLIILSTIYSVGALGITFLIPKIVPLWTNDIIKINLKDLYPFLLLTIIQVFFYSGAVFLNAFEKLKGQIFFSLLASILILPMSKWLFSLSVGIGSVPLSTSILIVPALVYVNYKSNVCINEI